MLILDLDGFHQATDDFPASGEICSVQALTNLVGEIFQATQHQAHFLALSGTFLGGRCVLLQACQSFAQTGHSRLELSFLQQPFFVTVN
jgi:hypothetical protein